MSKPECMKELRESKKCLERLKDKYIKELLQTWAPIADMTETDPKRIIDALGLHIQALYYSMGIFPIRMKPSGFSHLNQILKAIVQCSAFLDFLYMRLTRKKDSYDASKGL